MSLAQSSDHIIKAKSLLIQKEGGNELACQYIFSCLYEVHNNCSVCATKVHRPLKLNWKSQFCVHIFSFSLSKVKI